MLNRREIIQEIMAFSMIPLIGACSAESKKTFVFSVQGFDSLGSKNLNGRVYTKEALEKSFKTVSKIGCFYHNIEEYSVGINSTTISIFNCSHIVEKLHIEDEVCFAKIKIADTAFGKRLRKLIEENKVVFTPRGLGKIDSQGKIEDYKLLSIDAIEMKS